MTLNCLLYCLLPWPVFGHCLSTVPSMSFILFWVKPFLVHYFVFGLWFIGTDLVIAWQRVRNLMCPMVILLIWSVLLGDKSSQSDLACSLCWFSAFAAFSCWLKFQWKLSLVNIFNQIALLVIQGHTSLLKHACSSESLDSKHWLAEWMIDKSLTSALD